MDHFNRLRIGERLALGYGVITALLLLVLGLTLSHLGRIDDLNTAMINEQAERLSLATRAALEADGDLLDEDERIRIDRLLDRLAETARAEDSSAIEDATKALATGTENFAALRMNRGIQQALTGRRLDEV